MRSPAKRIGIALAAGVALVALVPALAQKTPQSILPPGFGEPDPAPPAAPKPATKPNEDRPARPTANPDDVPELTLRPPVQATAPNGTEDLVSDESDVGDSSDNASVAIAPPCEKMSQNQVDNLSG